VIMAGHVPPGFNEKIATVYPNDEFPINATNIMQHFNDALLNIFADYADIIQAHFYGHEHSDTFRLAYPFATAGEYAVTPNGAMFIAPSITPWGYLPQIPNHNPAFRVVNYSVANSTLGQVLDITTFMLDLNAANNDSSQRVFTQEYKYSQQYSTGNMVTVSGMQNAMSSIFESNTSYSKYLFWNSVSYPIGNYCTSDYCRRTQLCAIMQPYNSTFWQCLNMTAYQMPHWVWAVLIGSTVVLALMAAMALICTAISMRGRSVPVDEDRRPLIH